MACPTCDHTMQNLGIEAERKFWCPRCGTVKTCVGDFESVELPRWSSDRHGLLTLMDVVFRHAEGSLRDANLIDQVMCALSELNGPTATAPGKEVCAWCRNRPVSPQRSVCEECWRRRGA